MCKDHSPRDFVQWTHVAIVQLLKFSIAQVALAKLVAAICFMYVFAVKCQVVKVLSRPKCLFVLSVLLKMWFKLVMVSFFSFDLVNYWCWLNG